MQIKNLEKKNEDKYLFTIKFKFVTIISSLL